MIRLYTPDRWEVVEITTPDNTYRRVFGMWLGGYTSGNSWRLSSGITNVVTEGDLIHFENQSGSVYVVHKHARGMSAYGAGVYENLVNGAKDMTFKLVGNEYD